MQISPSIFLSYHHTRSKVLLLSNYQYMGPDYPACIVINPVGGYVSRAFSRHWQAACGLEKLAFISPSRHAASGMEIMDSPLG